MKDLQILTPANIEIEKALLRNIITVGKSAMDDVSHLLKTSDLFYEERNKQLFNLINKLYRSNMTIDMFTLTEGADENTINYVMDLITESTTVVTIGQNTNADYINILQQKYVKRRAIEAFYDMQKKLFDTLAPDYEAYYTIEKAYQQMSEILHGKHTIATMAETIQKSIDKLYERIAIRESGKLPGINTGLKRMNAMLAGWQPGELYVIAARPGMGKTALALHFAEHAARNGKPVLFFSLEMADYKLTDRMIIGETEIDSAKYHHANINNLDRENILHKANYLSGLQIYFDEQSGIDIDYIVSASRLAVRKNDIKMIIIDYLQLIDMKEKPGQTRDMAIGNVTRKLKQISKELSIPVILLSQLNRSLESRSDKEPNLADLRESGNIEQDADVVFMLFRPMYYKIESYNNVDSTNMLWILTKKFRNGLIENIGIHHNNTLTKFFDYGSAT
jgi:replicative DNA helicase